MAQFGAHAAAMLLKAALMVQAPDLYVNSSLDAGNARWQRSSHSSAATVASAAGRTEVS